MLSACAIAVHPVLMLEMVFFQGPFKPIVSIVIHSKIPIPSVTYKAQWLHSD